MIKYYHGSDDSIDKDVYYVFDEMPEFRECQIFCSCKEENRNIITIKDGIINNTFKGTIDECNNGLIQTYNLHHQEHPLLINRKLERDLLLKNLRVLRGIISYLSRTKYREIIKNALKGNFSDRLEVIKTIDFNVLIEENLEKTFNLKDILKVYAFQLGQSIALDIGIELYTKKEISNMFPKLKPFLYRENNIDLNNLIHYINVFIKNLEQYEIAEYKNNITYFDRPHYRFIDIKTEKEIVMEV